MICGLVMQEILQGLKSSRSTHLFQSRLQKLPFLPTRKSTYILAAGIFRKLKEKGVEVQTVDATIAAIAIENRVPLFTLKTCAILFPCVMYASSGFTLCLYPNRDPKRDRQHDFGGPLPDQIQDYENDGPQ